VQSAANSCRECNHKREQHKEAIRLAKTSGEQSCREPVAPSVHILLQCVCLALCTRLLPSMLRWMSYSLSTGRSLLRPLGSPTRPVAPPSRAMGVWPHAPAQASTIMPNRFPAQHTTKPGQQMACCSSCAAQVHRWVQFGHLSAVVLTVLLSKLQHSSCMQGTTV
jgi:hypothetical protein